MYKFNLLAISATVGISSILALPSTSSAIEYKSAIVKTNTVMYKTASTKNKIITLKKNAKVTIIRKAGSWTKVKYGSKQGYVLTKNLQLGTLSNELEKEAISKGQTLTDKDVKPFKDASLRGDGQYIYRNYTSLSTKINEYADYIDNLQLNTTTKEKLINSYVSPNIKLINSFEKDYESLKYMYLVNNKLKNYNYNDAEELYNKSLKYFNESKQLHAQNDYESMPQKLESYFVTQLKLRKQMLSHSTYEQLVSFKNVTGSKGFINITANNSFMNSIGDIKTNGIKTSGILNLPNSPNYMYRTVTFPKGTFKKVEFYVSVGAYSNLNSKDKFTFYINKGFSESKTYIMTPTKNNRGQVTFDLSNLDTFSLKIPKSSFQYKDIAFTDIKFYR